MKLAFNPLSVNVELESESPKEELYSVLYDIALSRNIKIDRDLNYRTEMFISYKYFGQERGRMYTRLLVEFAGYEPTCINIKLPTQSAYFLRFFCLIILGITIFQPTYLVTGIIIILAFLWQEWNNFRDLKKLETVINEFIQEADLKIIKS